MPVNNAAVAGAGTGSTPCSVLHRPAADVDRRAVDRIDASSDKRRASADDIADGIHRAHFVEMHFFDRDAVHLASASASL